MIVISLEMSDEPKEQYAVLGVVSTIREHYSPYVSQDRCHSENLRNEAGEIL